MGGGRRLYNRPIQRPRVFPPAGELDPLTPEEIARVEEFEERSHHIAKMWNYYVTEGRKSGAIPDGWDVTL